MKDTLAKYEMRLQNAVQLLNLAHQGYTASLMMRQPELIMASVTKALASMSVSSTPRVENGHTFKIIEDGKPTEPNQEVARERKQLGSFDTEVKRPRNRATYTNVLGLLGYSYSECENQLITNSTLHAHRFRLTFPNWLLSKAWEFFISNSCSGCTAHLKQYAVISCSSPVFRYAREGNIDELKKLFS